MIIEVITASLGEWFALLFITPIAFRERTPELEPFSVMLGVHVPNEIGLPLGHSLGITAWHETNENMIST